VSRAGRYCIRLIRGPGQCGQLPEISLDQAGHGHPGMNVGLELPAIHLMDW